jgi:hypothetical protein
MITRSVAVALVALTVAAPVEMLACGDKFLVPGRSARFKNKVDRDGVTILLYARPGTPLDATLRTLSLEARLRTAGYRPTLVTSLEDIERAFRGGGWDVVVADLADAAGFAGRLPASSGPSVLPVTYQVPKTTVSEAKRQYGQVLNQPGKHHTFVDAIDDVVATRARTRAKSAARAGE